MAKSVQIRRFTDIGLLRRLDFPLLVRLLEEHREFFESQPGFRWEIHPEYFQFDILSKIIANPDTGTPVQLLETLYYFEELARAEYYDDFLRIAENRMVPVRERIPVEDLMLTLWFECRDEMERFHAMVNRRDAVGRVRRFESFFPKDHRQKMCSPTSDHQARMEASLNRWAQANRRGNGVRVFIIPAPHAVWFMIRHGQPMKRQNTIEEDGGDGCVFFRPEKFDVVIYYPDTGELAMSVKLKGERRAMAAAIGEHLFGDADYFGMDGCSKYTLQPLIDDGADSLVCTRADIGMEEVVVREVQFSTKDANCSRITLRGDDIWRWLAKQSVIPITIRDFTIRKAIFHVRFTDKRCGRLVLETPNIGTYDHETDHEMIHRWLVARGFIRSMDMEKRIENESETVECEVTNVV